MATINRMLEIMPHMALLLFSNSKGLKTNRTKLMRMSTKGAIAFFPNKISVTF